MHRLAIFAELCYNKKQNMIRKWEITEKSPCPTHGKEKEYA